MNQLNWLSSEMQGQSLTQLGQLALALLLSALIGLEREIRITKSAGLRTHTLVGVGAALLMLVSKYGFGNVIVANQIVLDPSRVAAQVVSGIGFIGGGLIFVQRDIVRGLTTAAGIWLTAAVGMACGAGLPVLALFATATYFLVMFGFSRLSSRIVQAEECELLVEYKAGEGAVREILKLCTGRAFAVHGVTPKDGGANETGKNSILLRLRGRGDMDALVVAMSDLRAVTSVQRTSA
jgi:putative Mg2+ transporter-C (MgtC) family protein